MQQTVCRACFNQRSVRTVRQKVVFMIHPDRYKAHAKAVLEYEKKSVRRYSSEEKQSRRISDMELYYDKLMPTVYRRNGGLTEVGRKMLSLLCGLSPPCDTPGLGNRHAQHDAQELYLCGPNLHAGYV